MAYESLYHAGYLPGVGSRPRLQSIHPFRQLVAAGSNAQGAWSGSSGQSGYGYEPAEYDYHSGPPAHVPSGGSYSSHATAGTGYGVPPPVYHPPAKPPSSSGGKKKGGKKGSSTSTVTALTLLSFFFFVNLLQGCIKDHMDSMHPTVMVLTTNLKRSRFNKMGEMNSREHGAGAASASTFSSNAASNIVMQPADLLAAAAQNAATVSETLKPFANLQSPYNGIVGSLNKPVPQPPPTQTAINQYQSQNSEPEMEHHRPHYDANQPDVYEQQQQQQPVASPPHQVQPVASQYHPQQQQPPQYEESIIYKNYTYVNQQPPVYTGKPMDQKPYHHYHNRYPQAAVPTSYPPFPQYSTHRNPFYEHQHPTSFTYKGDQGPWQYADENHPKYPHKYDMASQQNSQDPVPWSSHMSSSLSVLSGPVRRATIISVSPTVKWASVPSNIDDRADFETEAEDEVYHSNDRYSEQN